MTDRSVSEALSQGLLLASRFELRERLGVGRYGTVWLAFDKVNSLLVALKILGDPEQRETLKAEWQTLRALNHAHVVRVFEFFDDEHVFYSMYFLDGASLAEVGARPQEEAIRAMALIAEALDYLHARDVVHGDIAPTNIVFDRGGSPYLIDFGSAWRGDTPVGSSRGTPSFQRADQSHPQPSSNDDVYSLGQVLRASIEGLDEAGSALIDALQYDDSRQLTAAAFVEALRLQGLTPARLPAAAIPADRAVSAPDVVATQLTRQSASVAGSQSRGETKATGGIPRWVWVSFALLLAVGVYVVAFLEPPQQRVAPLPGAAQVANASDEVVTDSPTGNALDDEKIEFSEGGDDDSLRSENVRTKNATDRTLGELLTKQEVLEKRGVEVWAGSEYRAALANYESGDRYYLAKDYSNAANEYRQAIDVFDALLGRADQAFSETLANAEAALSDADGVVARRLYERALRITPGEPDAVAGLERATVLDDVLALLNAGEDAEQQFDFETALLAYEKALALDAAWPAAIASRQRVMDSIRERDFRALMSDGFFALDGGELASAEKAFRSARKLKPDSREPIDGLQQVDQTRRLGAINRHVAAATAAEAAEDWAGAIKSFEAMLNVDNNLVTARDGLANARARLALDQQLASYVSAPDRLSEQKEIEAASSLLLKLAKIRKPGPKLIAQKNELSRVLKRAAQPLPVRLLSDGQTNVAVYKVGKLGRFTQTELSLRPGVYTVVGSRQGFRDVRLSLRVAPEVDMQPLVVQCEEAI